MEEGGGEEERQGCSKYLSQDTKSQESIHSKTIQIFHTKGHPNDILIIKKA